MSAEDIYGALIRKEWEKVRDLCNQHPEGPFVKISRRRDSVLQKGLYAGEDGLVLALLKDAETRFPEPRAFHDKLLRDVNSKGNTILHVAATQDSCVQAATRICEYAEHLLFVPNRKGEIPIISSVRYGQLKMFKFLHAKYTDHVPAQDLLYIYKVSNGRETYTILHTAIYNEHFELALHIATTIPGLISEKDHDKMTGLHMLAMNSSAFKIGYWKCLKFLLPSPFLHFLEDAIDDQVEDAPAPGTSNDIKPPQNVTTTNEIMKFASRFTMTIPCWSKIKKEHRRYQAARKLGSFLVENDTEWIDKLECTDVSDADDESEENSSGSASPENLSNAVEESVKQPKPESLELKYSENLNSDADEKSGEPPTPLILATKYGCVDIALEIIKQHPQTVEQVDRKYGSILHLAIKYRNIQIFDAVEESKMQMRRLVRLQDKDLNSILHMVALNTTKVKEENGSDATSTNHGVNNQSLPKPWDAEEVNNESRSPAFILQDDLLLFERVEDIMRTEFHTTTNKYLQTPEQLFAAKKEQLRDSAQEWMKRTAENCSIVAVLIATVAFAAAYTVPGGTDDQNGSPLLLKETFFVVFTITDVLSLAFTLTAVVVFLSILTSSYRLQDFKETLPKSLMFGISCLILSLTMMMFAFAATIILMIKNRQQWTRIALYAVAFLPVTVLVATYLPFYVPLMRTFHYTVDKAKSILPTPTFTRLKKPKLLLAQPSLSKTTTSLDPSAQV